MSRYKLYCGEDGVVVYDSRTGDCETGKRVAGPVSWETASRVASSLNTDGLNTVELNTARQDAEPSAPQCSNCAAARAAERLRIVVAVFARNGDARAQRAIEEAVALMKGSG